MLSSGDPFHHNIISLFNNLANLALNGYSEQIIDATICNVGLVYRVGISPLRPLAYMDSTTPPPAAPPIPPSLQLLKIGNGWKAHHTKRCNQSVN